MHANNHNLHNCRHSTLIKECSWVAAIHTMDISGFLYSGYCSHVALMFSPSQVQHQWLVWFDVTAYQAHHSVDVSTGFLDLK